MKHAQDQDPKCSKCINYRPHIFGKQFARCLGEESFYGSFCDIEREDDVLVTFCGPEGKHYKEDKNLTPLKRVWRYLKPVNLNKKKRQKDAWPEKEAAAFKQKNG